MAVELDVRQGVLLRAGEGETVTDRPDRELRILLAHELLDVTWTRCAPGRCSAEPHVHHRHVDAFYVLAGELRFVLGPEREEVRAPAGTFLAAPPDVVHGFRNEGPGEATYLNFHAPSTGFADYLRGRGSFDSHDPPADGGRPLAEAVVAGPDGGERFDREHGVVVIKAEFPQLSANDLTFVPEWEGIDPHTHADHVDAFFVLEGEVEFTLDGEVRVEEPGTFVAATPGVEHRFRIPDGGGAVRVLNVHAPDGGFAGRIRSR